MKTSRKMILSVLALVLTFIALGTTTFAWFSLSTVSKVSQITGDVRGGEGLEIRLVASYEGLDEDDELVTIVAKTDWKSNISGEDFTNFIKIAYANLEFNAITTEDGTIFKKMSTVDSVVNGADAEENKDYLVIKVQFKSVTSGTIVLDSYKLTGTGNVFTPELEYQQTESVTKDTIDVVNDPSNGARVSFEPTIGYDKSALVAYQKPETEASATPALNSTIYSLESNAILGNTANNEALAYGQYSFLTEAKAMPIFSNDGTSVQDLKVVNGKVVYNDDDEIDFLDAEVKVKDDDGDYLTYVDLIQNTNNSIDDVNVSEFVAEIEVKIWLEGWDVDTYDVLYLGTLNVELIFKKEEI